MNENDFDKIEIINDCTITSIEEPERFVPRRIIPPNPYKDKNNDIGIKKTGKRTYKKNLSSLSKPELPIQKIVEEKEEKQTDENDASLFSKNLKTNVDEEEIFDIPPKKFYGGRSNNNSNRGRTRAAKVKGGSEICPICSKSFPINLIEVSF